MSSRHGKEARQPKKPYTKPEVKQVQLRPEEAVLGNCKTTGFSGPSAINICISVTPCSSQGS
jgi:hypothetical protein